MSLSSHQTWPPSWSSSNYLRWGNVCNQIFYRITDLFFNSHVWIANELIPAHPPCIGTTIQPKLVTDKISTASPINSRDEDEWVLKIIEEFFTNNLLNNLLVPSEFRITSGDWRRAQSETGKSSSKFGLMKWQRDPFFVVFVVQHLLFIFRLYTFVSVNKRLLFFIRSID